MYISIYKTTMPGGILQKVTKSLDTPNPGVAVNLIVDDPNNSVFLEIIMWSLLLSELLGLIGHNFFCLIPCSGQL